MAQFGQSAPDENTVVGWTPQGNAPLGYGSAEAEGTGDSGPGQPGAGNSSPPAPNAPAGEEVLINPGYGNPGITWDEAVSEAGGVALDTTAADIQPLGTQAAGSVGKAADAGHVHPTTGLLTTAGNLSGLANTTTARTNLGFTTGNGTLVGGTLAVANTKVTASSTIMVTPTTSSSTTSGVLAVTAKTSGTGFTVTSSNAADIAAFAYVIIG